MHRCKEAAKLDIQSVYWKQNFQVHIFTWAQNIRLAKLVNGLKQKQI